MKFVSLWGFHHKWSARMLIFLGYLVLNALALIMGDILYSFDVQVSGLIVYLSAAAYLAAFIVYPASRKRRHYRNYYRFQKGCDAILLVTSFLLLISWASLRHNANSPFHFPAAQAVVPVNVQPSIAQAPATKDKVKLLVMRVKSKLSFTLQKIRAYYKSRSLGGQILLTVLAIALAVGALYLIMLLSCGVYCAGSAGGAVLIALAGTALVVFLFIRALRGIRRKYHREE